MLAELAPFLLNNMHFNPRQGPCPNGLQEVLNDLGMNFEIEEESEETQIQEQFKR